MRRFVLALALLGWRDRPRCATEGLLIPTDQSSRPWPASSGVKVDDRGASGHDDGAPVVPQSLRPGP